MPVGESPLLCASSGYCLPENFPDVPELIWHLGTDSGAEHLRRRGLPAYPHQHQQQHKHNATHTHTYTHTHQHTHTHTHTPPHCESLWSAHTHTHTPTHTHTHP